MSANARILVVEDSPTQREVLRAHLKAAGFGVVVAANGEQALGLLSDDIDLVISDVVMPGLDGYGLCRKIKATSPRLPVVLLTSLTDPLEVVHALDAGADNFLRKPYDPEQLIPRLRSILYNCSQRDSGRSSMGLELHFLNRTFQITAERQQILDLLISTFEDLVGANQQLREREEQLASAHDQLAGNLRAVELERQRLRTVLSAIPEPMVIIDDSGRITEASDAWASVGLDPEELIGRTAAEAAAVFSFEGRTGHHDNRLRSLVEEGADFEVGGAYDVVLNRSDGTRVPVIVRGAGVRDQAGRPVGAVALVSEIGRAAAHDPVTRLPTHALFAEQVARAAAASRDAGRAMAVLVVALERYDEVAGAIGRQAAEELIRDVAGSLRGFVRSGLTRSIAPGASLAYLGRDQFAVVLPELPNDYAAVRLATALNHYLSPSATLGEERLSLRSYIGVGFMSDRHAEAVDVVPDAIVAAGRATGHATGYEIFDPAVHAGAAVRLQQERQLQHAIEGGELEVHYQPVLRLDGAVVGAEALVRWRHPERGLLLPNDFIALAEETGLVVPLGWRVLHAACRQMAAWRRQTALSTLTVSVNVSAQQLNDAAIVERVRSTLDRTGLDPSALVLEITEAAVMADADASVDRLQALKDLGVRLDVDDFGTGYSSLLYLRRFPVDALKVDRAFVGGMTLHSEDAAIVAATISLGHALGLHVVAEGVETEDQLVALRTLGCDLAQGYLWSPPVVAPAFERWASAPGRGPSGRRGPRALVDRRRASPSAMSDQ